MRGSSTALRLCLAGAITSCATLTATSSALANTQKKLGVLLASHGDIDDIDTELEDYIKTSFKKNVGIPLPFWSRDLLVGPAYALSVQQVSAQYRIIGPTNYHANSLKQGAAVEKELKSMGVDAKVYLGYNFSRPLIETTLERMQEDGIESFVVINKGAQFSYASSGENIEDTLKYLKDHPEFDAEVLGVRQYSDDERFREVLANAIDRDARALFPNTEPEDLCVLVASHGLPQWLIDRKDPAIGQMKAAYARLQELLPDYRLYHGFLNDDFIPGAKWVSPDAPTTAEQMKADGCKNVLMDGRLSFTTHHRATFYDLDYDVRNYLETPDTLSNGKVDPNWEKPTVVLAPNFDEDKEFVSYLAQVIKEAFDGTGDAVVTLKLQGETALKPDSVGKPGVDPFF